MGENISEKVIDITGLELTPGKPAVCLGNGEQGFECCCDECDYYLLAFLNLIPKVKKKILLRIKLILDNRIKRTENEKILCPFWLVDNILFLSCKTVI